jgi:hypothetical protein
MRRLDPAMVKLFTRAITTTIACFALGACSGRTETVDDGARAPAGDAGEDSASECSAIQGCPPATQGDAGVTAHDASGAPPTPTPPAPPPPPPSGADASAPKNPPGCPTAPPPAGDICHVAGVSCAWKDPCSSTKCSCEALGNGPASWQCSGTDICEDAGH